MFGALYRDNHDTRGLMGITETLAAQNRLDDAIKEMDKAIAAEPNRQDLKLGRANLYVRAQRYDEAIATFKSMLEKAAGLGRFALPAGGDLPPQRRYQSGGRYVPQVQPGGPQQHRFRWCNWA